MQSASFAQVANRYGSISEAKATGATYTPGELADFVAESMLRVWGGQHQGVLRILDPAAGDGALLGSLLERLPADVPVEVHGFDTNAVALAATKRRLAVIRDSLTLHLSCEDFLNSVLGERDVLHEGGLFGSPTAESYDLIIANPPYVRTQVLGAEAAGGLAEKFGLRGRVDLYHAFLLAIAEVLRPNGVAGVIVSNRFMTTKAGASVRRAATQRLNLRHVWDLGDTKLFDAAVLPAVLVASGLNGERPGTPSFTSVYETKATATAKAESVAEALAESGIVGISDGRRFEVLKGTLDTSGAVDGVWRVATEENDAWLSTVGDHSWGRFRDLGKVRVGVKTCADGVFIRSDWGTMPAEERPELLRPLTTHHIARRYRAETGSSRREIVYPHETVGGGKRAIRLDAAPRTRAYLEQHRSTLEGRKYVLEAGRQWYEIWVPQQPAQWPRPKLVFRDISEQPCFWLDLEGSVINGDCYWLTCDDPSEEELLWLAVAVGNSRFIEIFYDRSFNNKLYAGRRRFITQYVEKFPLPDPQQSVCKKIIEKAQAIYACAGTEEATTFESEVDHLVWEAFGLPVEEV